MKQYRSNIYKILFTKYTYDNNQCQYLDIKVIGITASKTDEIFENRYSLNTCGYSSKSYTNAFGFPLYGLHIDTNFDSSEWFDYLPWFEKNHYVSIKGIVVDYVRDLKIGFIVDD